MCKPGSPHYGANIRDLLVKDKARASETGGQGEKNTAGEQKGDRGCWQGSPRAKTKDTDKEQNTDGRSEPRVARCVEGFGDAGCKRDEAAKAEDDDRGTA